jgi:hypothetical protein
MILSELMVDIQSQIFIQGDKECLYIQKIGC